MPLKERPGLHPKYREEKPVDWCYQHSMSLHKCEHLHTVHVPPYHYEYPYR